MPGTGWAGGDEKRLTAGPRVPGLAVERERACPAPCCCGRNAAVGGKQGRARGWGRNPLTSQNTTIWIS